MSCRELQSSSDFCVAVASLAAMAGVGEPYASIVADHCVAGDPACIVCFELQNYCEQVGDADACTDLRSKCLCAADYFGVD